MQRYDTGLFIAREGEQSFLLPSRAGENVGVGLCGSSERSERVAQEKDLFWTFKHIFMVVGDCPHSTFAQSKPSHPGPIDSLVLKP
jgi:hypothetical protein